MLEWRRKGILRRVRVAEKKKCSIPISWSSMPLNFSFSFSSTVTDTTVAGILVSVRVAEKEKCRGIHG